MDLYQDIPCPPNTELCSAPQYPAPVLSTDGILFAVASDGKLHARDSRSGKVLWTVPTPLDYYRISARVLGGGGKYLLLDRIYDGLWLLDAESGAAIGPVDRPCYGLAVGLLGWTMASACAGDAETFGVCPALVDPTGLAWTDSTPVAMLTVPGELLLVGIFPADTTNTYPRQPRDLVLYRRDGSVAAGPAFAQGNPIAVGADGTIFSSACVPAAKPSINPTPRIAAFSPDLQELWRIDLDGTCDYYSHDEAVLDRDGVLYLGRHGNTYHTTNLTAVQTQSPGLAHSSWPLARHDNQGTAWLQH